MFHLYIFQYVWGGKELFKKMTTKNFLAVLWSGFHTSTVGVMDWIPDLETKILQATPEDNPLQTTEASQFITPDKINENFLISNIHCLNYLDCFINSFFQYVQDLNKVYPVWLVDLCLKSLSVCRLYLFLPSPFSFLFLFFFSNVFVEKTWDFILWYFLLCVFYRLYLLHCLTYFLILCVF